MAKNRQAADWYFGRGCQAGLFIGLVAVEGVGVISFKQPGWETKLLFGALRTAGNTFLFYPKTWHNGTPRKTSDLLAQTAVEVILSIGGEFVNQDEVHVLVKIGFGALCGGLRCLQSQWLRPPHRFICSKVSCQFAVGALGATIMAGGRCFTQNYVRRRTYKPPFRIFFRAAKVVVIEVLSEWCCGGGTILNLDFSAVGVSVLSEVIPAILEEGAECCRQKLYQSD